MIVDIMFCGLFNQISDRLHCGYQSFNSTVTWEKKCRGFDIV